MKAGRGAGKRGGKGNAGIHKHKFMSMIKQGQTWGRHGFKRHRSIRKGGEVINLFDLDEHLDKYLSTGKAQKEGDVYHVDLGKLGYHKLLGTGTLSKKVKVTVPEASASAIEKVASAGGEVQTTDSDEEFEEKTD